MPNDEGMTTSTGRSVFGHLGLIRYSSFARRHFNHLSLLLAR